MDRYWKTKGVKALLLLQSCWALLFQAISKGQFAKGCLQRAAQTIQQHVWKSPQSTVQQAGWLVCFLPPLLYGNCNEQFFGQTKYRKIPHLLPSPCFLVIQRIEMSQDKTETRTVLAPFKVSDKGSASLEVWDCLSAASPESCTLHPCLAALGSLWDRAQLHPFGCQLVDMKTTIWRNARVPKLCNKHSQRRHT